METKHFKLNNKWLKEKASLSNRNSGEFQFKIPWNDDKKEEIYEHKTPKERIPIAYGIRSQSYVDDIFDYMLMKEWKYLCEENFPDCKKIDSVMRSKTVDWLVMVHSNASLEQETLHQAVNIMDRYSEASEWETGRTYMLVGLTALCLAAKFHNRKTKLKHFEKVCGCDYTVNHIRKKEVDILKALNYDLSSVSAVEFLRLFSRKVKLKDLQYACCKFLVDLSLLEYSFCHVRPSLVATTAIFVSLCVSQMFVDQGLWTHNHTSVTTYHLHEIKETVRQLSHTINSNFPSTFQSVRRKYSSSHYYFVSDSLHPRSNIVKELLTFT